MTGHGYTQQQRSKAMTTAIEYATKALTEGGQNAEYQFEDGSDERRAAALFSEMVVSQFPAISKTADKPTLNKAIGGTLAAMRDIQVRDYILGVAGNLDKNTLKDTLESLISVATDEFIDAPACILAVAYYELDDTDTALSTLDKTAENYPMANLLRRVFTAGWPKESFVQMRDELHPKVVAGIFEEKE